MRRSRLAIVTLLSLSTLGFACVEPPPPKRVGGAGGDGGDGGDGGGAGGSGGGGKAGSGGKGGGGAGGGGQGGGGTGGGGQGGGGTGGGGQGGGQAELGCLPAMPDSLCCRPLGKMPKSLKDTGLFPAAPDFSMPVAACLREFVPDMPLWSDGMEKQRFVLLPRNGKIDNSKPKAWVFPVGTTFIKTFFDDTGAGGKPRPIETRFIRRAREGQEEFDFEYYLYKWNAQGTDAELILDDMVTDPQLSQNVPITITHIPRPFMVNNGMPFMHTLPSREMCTDCHKDNATYRQTFIGFDSARLNMKRTKESAKTQLEELDDAKLFMKPLAPPEVITNDDVTSEAGMRQLRVKRWIFGNCVHCHNGDKVFDMHPDVLLKNTINMDEDSQTVVAPMGWKRVAPGSPQTSIVFVQAQRTMLPPNVNGIRLRAMPPIGVADLAADQTALADLRTWIMTLPKP